MTIVLFLLSILGANLAVTYLDPVSVGFGLYAPAGVYFVALTLALRDLVQRRHGVPGLVCAGLGGVALSLALADPAVVWASCAAFVVSFLIDTAIFTLVMRDTERLWLAVLISGLISLVPDTLVFLYMAGLEQFIPGQLIGKMYGTLAYAAVIAMTPRREEQAPPADGYGIR